LAISEWVDPLECASALAQPSKGPLEERTMKGPPGAPYPCQVECCGRGGDPLLDSCISDLSETGAYIHTRSTLPVGVRVHLRIQVRAQLICAEAEVVLAVYSATRPGVGVRFVNPPPGTAALLAGLVGARSG
jgi:hypothetical protein